MKNRIKTLNVTYDSFDKVYYIVCPECGMDLQYIHRSREKCECVCGYYWHVAYVAIGEKAEVDEDNE